MKTRYFNIKLYVGYILKALFSQGNDHSFHFEHEEGAYCLPYDLRVVVCTMLGVHSYFTLWTTHKLLFEILIFENKFFENKAFCPYSMRDKESLEWSESTVVDHV